MHDEPKSNIDIQAKIGVISEIHRISSFADEVMKTALSLCDAISPILAEGTPETKEDKSRREPISPVICDLNVVYVKLDNVNDLLHNMQERLTL